MSNIVDLSTFLSPGTVYTMSFSASILSYISGSAFDTAAMDGALATISGISQAQAWQPNHFSSQVNVTFTYTGDGSDVVANLYQTIVQALEDSTSGTFDYVGTVINPGGEVPGTQPNALGSQPIKVPALDLSSSLWAIALIGLLVVFVYSGGATATRAALA